MNSLLNPAFRFPQHRRRWIACGFLFAATTLNYLDRQTLAPLKPLWDSQFHWSNRDYGWINGVFSFAAAFGAIFFGRLVDRTSLKVGYAVAVALWSVATLGHAFAASVFGFTIWRFLLGVGEGGNFPCAIKAVAMWFPQTERALATSILNVGANLGALLAPAVVSWLMYRWGWQAVFVICGAAGLLWLRAWWQSYSLLEGPPQSGISPCVPPPHPTQGPLLNAMSWRELLRYRQTWAFASAKFLTDPVWSFFLIWLPDFFHKAHQLDFRSNSRALVLMYTIVTVLSVAGGWLTGYLVRVGLPVNRARKIGLLASAVGALPMMALNAAGTWTAVAILGLAGAAHQAWSANLFTMVSDHFPTRTVATVVGIGSVAGAISSLFFPILTGFWLDQLRSPEDAPGAYYALFALCASTYATALLVVHGLTRNARAIADD